jgi:uncharacterized RDD family membrane protein YckC
VALAQGTMSPVTSSERHPTRPTPRWFDEPSLAQRFFGSMIDSLVLLPVSAVYFFWSGAGALAFVVAVHAVYEIGLTASRGQTVGKRFVGTRVVDSVDGDLIDVKRATMRWLALGGIFSLASLGSPNLSVVPGIYVLVVGVMVLRPPLHEGLHDRVAGTLVTRAP